MRYCSITQIFSTAMPSHFCFVIIVLLLPLLCISFTCYLIRGSWIGFLMGLCDCSVSPTCLGVWMSDREYN
ncbi:hypothetical protein VNO80_29536 [Phaseolus coccineus]|uniref:Uncharacterized protein n=1 Tax=Phaseolus coccineus TaxID=3886 RepID=A0AAN9QF44_PHACN